MAIKRTRTAAIENGEGKHEEFQKMRFLIPQIVRHRPVTILREGPVSDRELRNLPKRGHGLPVRGLDTPISFRIIVMSFRIQLDYTGVFSYYVADFNPDR
jgi:hypothetical protein